MEEEKKEIRISLSTFLLLIAIAIIIVMGVYIYLLKTSKTNETQIQSDKISNIYERVDNSIEQSDTTENDSNSKNIAYPNLGNRIDASKEYVYALQEYDTNKLPFINIDSEDIKKINDEWEKYFKENKNSMNLFEKGKDKETVLYYTYAIEHDKELLSVQIYYGTVYDATDSDPESKYYNIDIKTGKILTNKELFDKLSLSKEEIQQDIKNAIRQEYNRSVKVLGQNKYKNFDSYMSAVKYYYDDIYDTKIYLLGSNKLCIEGITTPESLDYSALIIDLYNY